MILRCENVKTRVFSAKPKRIEVEFIALGCPLLWGVMVLGFLHLVKLNGLAKNRVICEPATLPKIPEHGVICEQFTIISENKIRPSATRSQKFPKNFAFELWSALLGLHSPHLCRCALAFSFAFALAPAAAPSSHSRRGPS